ncbi:ABC transporter permease [Patescibacteria group bacterium]|nr:ABC transporter permease [Patescibacteria group bacterium]
MPKNIITIWKKELKDTIRDRRTLVAMILMPMFLMPAMTIGMFKLMDKIMKDQEKQTVKIALSGEDNSPELAEMIKSQEKLEIVSMNKDERKAVKEEEIDAAVVIPEDFQEKIEKQESASIDLIIKSTNTKSANVATILSVIITEFNNQVLQKRFSEQNIDSKILSKVSILPEDVATEKETGGFVLGFLIPLFIVMWSIIGGQYTAIDVSAGEKERKTLESLLLTSVKRRDIVFGKFLAVSSVAFVSVVVAIGSFYAALMYAGGFGPMDATGSGIAGSVAVNFSIEPQAILLLLAVSVFLILMFSAIILSISIFAKSFKEAQNYIGPSYLVVILPVVLVNSIPGFEPTLWYFAIPAVNATLLFKEVLMGTYDFGHIILTMGSLIIYSTIAILLAVKIYSKEGVLFRD